MERCKNCEKKIQLLRLLRELAEDGDLEVGSVSYQSLHTAARARRLDVTNRDIRDFLRGPLPP